MAATGSKPLPDGLKILEDINPKPPDPKISYAEAVLGVSDGLQRPSPLFSDSVRSLSPQKSIFKGKPAIVFSKSDIDCLASPFKLALIGKFPYGRPPVEILKKEFLTIGLLGHINIGVVDSRHILIRPEKEEDFHRLWIKENWRIRSYPMKISRWSPEFNPNVDSPILPIWVNLPGLPVHFFMKEALFAIGSLLGSPLKVDMATLNLSRPSVARLCIAMDVREEIPEAIYIGSGKEGFWQQIELKKAPRFCIKCTKLGHIAKDCGKEAAQKATTMIYRQIVKPSSKDLVQSSKNQEVKLKEQEVIPKIADITGKGDGPSLDASVSGNDSQGVAEGEGALISHHAKGMEEQVEIDNYDGSLKKTGPRISSENRNIENFEVLKPLIDLSPQAEVLEDGEVRSSDNIDWRDLNDLEVEHVHFKKVNLEKFLSRDDTALMEETSSSDESSKSLPCLNINRKDIGDIRSRGLMHSPSKTFSLSELLIIYQKDSELKTDRTDSDKVPPRSSSDIGSIADEDLLQDLVENSYVLEQEQIEETPFIEVTKKRRSRDQGWGIRVSSRTHKPNPKYFH